MTGLNAAFAKGRKTSREHSTPETPQRSECNRFQGATVTGVTHLPITIHHFLTERHHELRREGSPQILLHPAGGASNVFQDVVIPLTKALDNPDPRCVRSTAPERVFDEKFVCFSFSFVRFFVLPRALSLISLPSVTGTYFSHFRMMIRQA